MDDLGLCKVLRMILRHDVQIRMGEEWKNGGWMQAWRVREG